MCILCLLLLAVAMAVSPTTASTLTDSQGNHTQQAEREEAVRVALRGIAVSRSGSATMISIMGSDHQYPATRVELAWNDCVKLYDDTEFRLKRLAGRRRRRRHSLEDARTWLSGALASHASCLDGLRESHAAQPGDRAESLTLALRHALASYSPSTPDNYTSIRWQGGVVQEEEGGQADGLLTSATPPHITVAKDGSGDYKTINEAVTEVARWKEKRPPRVVIYVKSGVYAENVEIDRGLRDLTFVGDGIDKTVVTGNRNVVDGSTTLQSATFGVLGDGFWARDMTFENTAGPEKHQAVALRSSSDLSVFYRCSFRGYQDTLLVHSQRQFYRDCHVYGTVDFIFGDAAAVLQNCDILVRKPMSHQANMITAQGRDDPSQNTGISIHDCRVGPAPEFRAVKGSFRTYLGRPWKRYSRAVVMKTDLDGLVDPRGWSPWSGDFALSTLYYGEYMNSGAGAETGARVRWPGFHLLKDAVDARRFTVGEFIQGESWIPGSGAPFDSGL